MTVLQLGPYPPPHGGVQTNLVAIREHLRRHGAEAPIINLTRYRRADADGVSYPATPFDVMRLLLTIPADIVHLHVGGRFTRRLLALCLFCTLLPRRRVVLTLHSGGYPAEGGRNARRASVRAWILRRLDAVIAVNEEIAALFRRLGVAPARVAMICPYAPVSVREDVALPPQVQAFMAAHRPLLTTIGLLEPEYDIATQIRALASVRRWAPDTGLLVIGGSGTQEAEIRRLLATQSDAAHVLLCGDLPHPAAIRIVAGSDVFLRTTLYDGDSISVREALQLGVPVIATDNGMRPAGVHLIPVSDVPALGAAIEGVLGVPRAAAPSAGSEHLDEVLTLYARLLGRPSPPATSTVP